MKKLILLALCFSLPAFSAENTLDSLLLKVKAQQSGNRHLEAQRNTDFSADVATLKVKLK